LARRVAYCFLFRSEPLCWELWWRDFFLHCGPGMVAIHSKRAPTSELARRFALPRARTVPTAWGHASIIEATLVLFRHVLEQELEPCSLLCVLSESCIPLSGRESLERKLWDLSLQGSTSLLPTKGVGPAPHEQWCVLTRDAASALALGRPLLPALSLFGCPDEMYIGLALEAEGRPWRRAKTTHTSRSEDRPHPKTYSLEELTLISVDPSSVFLRKVNLNQAPPIWWRALMRD
jgi:hypothetical protein